MTFSRLRTARPDERGSILIMSVVGMVVALIAASLAVDIGFLAHEIRVDQKVADLAALDAARVLAANPAGVGSAAQASALRNGFPTAPGYSVTAVEGVKVTSGGTDVCQAQAGAGTVCVTATSPHKNFFPFVGAVGSKNRVAVAGSGNAMGTVRVGSTLVTVAGSLPLQQVGLLNKSMSALISGTYSTNAVGWQGLASGGVKFGALTSALAAVTGNGTFNVGTTSQVLQATFTAAQLFTATANALNNSGNAADVSVANSVQNIGAQANGTYLNLPLKLYDLFNFGSVVAGNKQDVADMTLNVLELIKGGAILADGDHFASFNLAVGDIVGGVIPGGFSGATVSLGLIEAPQQSFPGPAGKDAANNYYTSAHTSQIRVRLEVNFNIPLTSVLTLPLVGSISVISVKVPYYLDLGEAHAYLDHINCDTTAQPTAVGIRGTTDTGHATLGLVSDANLENRVVPPIPQTGVIGSALGGAVQVSITSTTGTSIPGNSGVDLTFQPPYTNASPSQPVPGGPIVLPSLANTNTTVTVLGLVNTGILNDIVSGVNVSGLTFSSGTVGVDTSIVQPLYDALGLSFASADVWAPPVQTCAALSTLPAVASNNPPVLRG